MPQTFFTTLDNWFPLPQLALLMLFLAVAGASTFGFSLYPNSRLSPRRPIFWIWLVIASVGLVSAFSQGSAIREAYDRGQKQAAALVQDQARLQSLFGKRNGHVEPFQRRDLDIARELQKPRVIVNAAAVAEDVPSRAFYTLLPTLLFLVAYPAFLTSEAIRGR